MAFISMNINFSKHFEVMSNHDVSLRYYEDVVDLFVPVANFFFTDEGGVIKVKENDTVLAI